MLKKPQRYVTILEEEDESGDPEDNKNRDPDYNPFFDKGTLFQDPRRTHEEATQAPPKKEENIACNSMQKLLEDKGYPFKKINEDVYKSDGYVEENWYEPKGNDSLQYHSS